MEDKKALVDKVDAFIFDCDGVIWRGDSVIDGVPETLDWLRSLVSLAERLKRSWGTRRELYLGL